MPLRPVYFLGNGIFLSNILLSESEFGLTEMSGGVANSEQDSI